LRATYVDDEGRIRRVSAPTRIEVEARRDEQLEQVNGGTPVAGRFDGQTTVSEFLDWWLETVARHRVKTSTMGRYRRFAGGLASGIGARRVVEVDSETLADWQSKLLDRYAPYTVLNCRRVCRQAFLEAVKLGPIATNPFDLVKAPQAKRVTAGRALSRRGQTADQRGSGPTAGCRPDAAVLSGLERERSARPRLGGSGPRRRHGPHPLGAA